MKFIHESRVEILSPLILFGFLRNNSRNVYFQGMMIDRFKIYPYFSRENFRKTFGRIFDELPSSWQWLRFKKTINHLSLVSLRSSFITCLLIELYRSTGTRFAWISARLEIFLLTFHGILEWFITNIPGLHRKWQIFTTRQPEIQGTVWLESIFLT